MAEFTIKDDLNIKIGDTIRVKNKVSNGELYCHRRYVAEGQLGLVKDIILKYDIEYVIEFDSYIDCYGDVETNKIIFELPSEYVEGV